MPSYRPRSASSSTVALDYEIAQEQAAALGRAGRALEAALAALLEYDRNVRAAGEARAKLVDDAGEALWRLLVQRECCGLREPAASHERLSDPSRGAKPDRDISRPQAQNALNCHRPIQTLASRPPVAGATTLLA